MQSPGFSPLGDSKTLFLDNFRAYTFLGGGIKANLVLVKNLEWRNEAYLFQPYKILQNNSDQKATFAQPSYGRRFAASTTLVYFTPLFPIAISVNYYDDPKKRFGFFLNIGYLIFNRRALD